MLDYVTPSYAVAGFPVDSLDIKHCRDTAELFDSFSTEDFQLVLCRARYGIAEDARLFFQICAMCLSECELPPFGYAEAISIRFREISESADPWRSNFFEKSRSQNGRAHFLRDLRIALAIAARMERKKISAGAAAVQLEMEHAHAATLGRSDHAVPIGSAEKAERVYRRFFPSGDRRTSAAAKAARKPNTPKLVELFEQHASEGFENWPPASVLFRAGLS